MGNRAKEVFQDLMLRLRGSVGSIPVAGERFLAAARNDKGGMTLSCQMSLKFPKGTNILSLDLKKIPESTSDFFIICEANNTTQLKAIADFVELEVKTKCGEIPYKSEGKNTAQWLLID